MIITGGIGKDSGDLKIPEAQYLADEVYRDSHETGLHLPDMHLETEATNGGGNP